MKNKRLAMDSQMTQKTKNRKFQNRGDNRM